MADEIKLTGYDAIYNKVQQNSTKEIKKEEFASVIDELKNEQGDINSVSLRDVLSAKFNIDDKNDALLYLIDEVAKIDNDKTLNLNDLNSTYDNSNNTVHISDFDLTQETCDNIKSDIENEINNKKIALENKKQSRGIITAPWNWIKGVFGGGDKKEAKEIDNLQKQLDEINQTQDVSKLDELYKATFDRTLKAEKIENIEQANNFCSSLSNENKAEIANFLENQLDSIKQIQDQSESENGWISGLWHGFKNLTGIGASSDKIDAKFDSTRKTLEDLKNNPDNLANAYKTLTGNDLTQEEFLKLQDGQRSLSVLNDVIEYQNGQQMGVDTIADVVTGIGSLAIAAAGVALAPVSGGTSLVLTCAAAGGVNAVMKPLFKATDCIGNEKTYNWETDFKYDATTGFINGAMAPLANGAGTMAGSAGKTAMKQLGFEAVEETVKGTGKQALKTTLTNKIVTNAPKVVSRAVEGSLVGAADAGGRAVAQGRYEDIVSDSIKGAEAGFVASPILGWGMDVALKPLSKKAAGMTDDIVRNSDDILNDSGIIDDITRNSDDILNDFTNSLTDDYERALAEGLDDVFSNNSTKPKTTDIDAPLEYAFADDMGDALNQIFKEMNDEKLFDIANFVDETQDVIPLSNNEYLIPNPDASVNIGSTKIKLSEISTYQKEVLESAGVFIDKTDNGFLIKNIDVDNLNPNANKFATNGFSNDIVKIDINNETILKPGEYLIDNPDACIDLGNTQIKLSQISDYQKGILENIGIVVDKTDDGFIVKNVTQDLDLKITSDNNFKINTADTDLTPKPAESAVVDPKVDVDVQTDDFVSKFDEGIEPDIDVDLSDVVKEADEINKLLAENDLTPKPAESAVVEPKVDVEKIVVNSSDISTLDKNKSYLINDPDAFIDIEGVGRLPIKDITEDLLDDLQEDGVFLEIKKTTDGFEVANFADSKIRILNQENELLLSNLHDKNVLVNQLEDQYQKLKQTGAYKNPAYQTNTFTNKTDIKKSVATSNNNVKLKKYEKVWCDRSAKGASVDYQGQRASLNVKADSNLIKELDELMTQGTYTNSKGKKVSIDNTEFHYKTYNADNIEKWANREDPITLYFNGNVNDATKRALVDITKKYQRGTLSTRENKTNFWINIESQPTTAQTNALLDKAYNVSDELGSALEESLGNQTVFSSGQYKAYKEVVEQYQKVSNFDNNIAIVNQNSSSVAKNVSQEILAVQVDDLANVKTETLADNIDINNQNPSKSLADNEIQPDNIKETKPVKQVDSTDAKVENVNKINSTTSTVQHKTTFSTNDIDTLQTLKQNEKYYINIEPTKDKYGYRECEPFYLKVEGVTRGYDLSRLGSFEIEGLNRLGIEVTYNGNQMEIVNNGAKNAKFIGRTESENLFEFLPKYKIKESYKNVSKFGDDVNYEIYDSVFQEPQNNLIKQTKPRYGWGYIRQKADLGDVYSGQKVLLNVNFDANLIKELDELMTQGTYTNANGQKIKLNDADFCYRVSDRNWGDYENPINLYFKENVSLEAQEAISEITKKYQRGAISGCEDSSTPWMNIKNPISEQEKNNLIQKARNIDNSNGDNYLLEQVRHYILNDENFFEIEDAAVIDNYINYCQEILKF